MVRGKNVFFLAFVAPVRKNFSDSIPALSKSQGSPACHRPYIQAMFPKYSCRASPRGILMRKYMCLQENYSKLWNILQDAYVYQKFLLL